VKEKGEERKEKGVLANRENGGLRILYKEGTAGRLTTRGKKRTVGEMKKATN